MHFLNFKLSVFPGVVVLCTTLTQARMSVRNTMVEPSVIFYDDINQIGASYSPAQIIPGDCQTLPGNWLDRAESVLIGPGYTCNFYVNAGCEGVGQQLSGIVGILSGSSSPALYNSIESFSCNKVV